MSTIPWQIFRLWWMKFILNHVRIFYNGAGECAQNDSHTFMSVIMIIQQLSMKWPSVSVAVSWYHLGFIPLLNPWSTKSLQCMHVISLSKCLIGRGGQKKIQNIRCTTGTPWMGHLGDITKNKTSPHNRRKKKMKNCSQRELRQSRWSCTYIWYTRLVPAYHNNII